MHDIFKEYQLTSWVENGLLKRVEPMVDLVKVTVASVLVAAAAPLSASASNLDFNGYADPVANAMLQAQISHHPAMEDVRQLSAAFRDSLSHLDSADHSDIDADLLAYAERAIGVVEARKKN